MDYDATTGDFHYLFDNILYGYYYPSWCKKGKHTHSLNFILFFRDPFDPVLDEPIWGKPDWNGFCKNETDTFKSIEEFNQEIKRKNIQIVTVEYKDGCNYEDPSFLEKLFGTKSYLPQYTNLKENSILYKVEFNIPFDVLSDHIKVDKIQYTSKEKEKIISIYNPKDTDNIVQQLFLKMKRAESNIEEMGIIFDKIKKDPIRFKQDNADNSWAKECVKDGCNIEHADILYKKLQRDMESMHKILWQARYFDIKAEPDEVNDTKCSHDLCIRNRVDGSEYCDKCVQLPTKQCNFCEKVIK